MATIGPHMPDCLPRSSNNHTPSSSNLAPSDSSIGTSFSSRSPPCPSTSESRRSPRTIIGPHIPTNLTRSRSNSTSSSTSTSSDQGIGPVLPTSSPSHNHNGLSDGVRAFLEREASNKMAEEEAKAAAEKATNSRPEWMLLPPSVSNSTSLQAVAGDPLNLRSRGFAQSTPRVSARGGGGGGGAGQEADMSLWTEKPEERIKRMQDEVSGVKPKGGNGTTDEAMERERLIRRDAMIAHKVREERGAKKSLIQEHNERRRREIKEKLQDEFNTEREQRRREKRLRDDEDQVTKNSRHSHSEDKRRSRRHRSRSSSPDKGDRSTQASRSDRHRSSRHDDSHHRVHRSRHDSDNSNHDEKRRERRKRKESDRHGSSGKDTDKYKEKDRDRDSGKGTKSRKEREQEDVRQGKAAAPMIWDREAALSVGGRLMDEKKRRNLIADSNALGDRFGSGSRRFL
ncbi:uncharacterized protein MEPE_04616 [Melanopsichium pennsylvanicum]|uniref:DUF3752 domain-containing protein n=2 Tax=Melanopsichium pennsylvanicum TaxID=63383 RepID=A0AAJ5C6J3_9BASI|nr:hypothetical protein BN887_00624 [Melanopsichium pennsylvanicum 4]SNX85907.1 uncharacterized protein MEPE_04616 [Melanopsichium pennsylvanicum]